MIAGLGKKRGGTIKFMDTQQDEVGQGENTGEARMTTLGDTVSKLQV
jgi:hypothetical protein